MCLSAINQVVEAIAEAEDTEPVELDMALQNHVSTEAIHHLEEHPSDAWRLQFDTQNHVVELTGTGTVLVDGEPT